MATKVATASARSTADMILRQLADVDYDQWGRTRPPATLPSPGYVQVGPRPPKVVHRPGSGLVPGNARATSAGGRGLASACRKIWVTGRGGPVKDESRAERIRLLQLKVQARKTTISDYKRRYVELIELNRELRNAITSEESGVHNEVNSLLIKYGKFRSGISLLNSKFSEDYTLARLDLESTSIRVDKELEELRREVNILDEKLRNNQKEVYILSNYKEIDYPVKSLRMDSLKNELETLTSEHQDEQEELETIIGAELAKMNQSREQIRTGIIAEVTDDYLSQLHPSLESMALQNMVMKKEIKFHRREIEMLLRSNKELERQINPLKHGRETNVRVQMFPQLYPLKPICTPEMDVVLDIPKQEWLPI